MRSIVRLGFGMMLAFVVLGLVLYSSCKRGNNCDGVLCVNTGHCADGFCVCPTGTGGDSCEITFRTLYANKYAGSANVNTAHLGYTLVFSVPPSAVGFLSMELTVLKTAGGATDIPSLPLLLSSSATATSGPFTISPVTINGTTYNGTGVLYAKAMSMTLYKSRPGVIDTTYVCDNFVLQ